MYVVLVEFTINPEHVQAFRQRVQQQAQDSLREESECRVFDVCIDPDRDDFVLLYEIYSDRNAFELHLASAHFRDFDKTVQGWISDKKIATYERL